VHWQASISLAQRSSGMRRWRHSSTTQCHVQVKMRPVVNVVDDKNSRIRTLEEEVRMLRSELASKEQQNQLESDTSSTSAADVAEALQAQLQRNEALTQEKESLARCGGAAAAVSASVQRSLGSKCMWRARSHAGRLPGWSGWC
jgi:hypothetical protein